MNTVSIASLKSHYNSFTHKIIFIPTVLGTLNKIFSKSDFYIIKKLTMKLYALRRKNTSQHVHWECNNGIKHISTYFLY